MIITPTPSTNVDFSYDTSKPTYSQRKNHNHQLHRYAAGNSYELFVRDKSYLNVNKDNNGYILS
jgi:hypothetical protein